jgi:hypothetical protein
MSVGYQNGNEKRRTSAGQGADPDWDTLKSDVGDIAGAAVERGRHFLDSAREQASDYADRRKDNVAQSVSDFATSLRESTRSFDDRPNIRAFVDSAAEGLDQFADSIRERTVSELFNDVEDIVRERPAIVAAVTVAIGFLTARFIKSSAEGLRQGHSGRGRAGHAPRRAEVRSDVGPAPTGAEGGFHGA